MTPSSLVLQTTSLSIFRRTLCAVATIATRRRSGRLAGWLPPPRSPQHPWVYRLHHGLLHSLLCGLQGDFNIIPNFTTNSNVCDATLRMDDTVSEKSQSSETSRTIVYPKVSLSSSSTVEKQSSDASSFVVPMGSRCKDLFPIEKSVDATLLKPHLLGVSRLTHCSIPFYDYLYWFILV